MSCLPWHDEDLHDETASITSELAEINLRGVLTINSQPAVNAAPSDDKVFGWGGSGGYVYQKAYLEFFTTESNVEALKFVLKRYGSRVNYHIVNCSVSPEVANMTGGLSFVSCNFSVN